MIMIGKTYLTADQYIEYSCEVADKIMEMKSGEEYYTEYSYLDRDNVVRYTDEGQDIFNDILAHVEEFLSDVGIYIESEEEKKNVRPI
tara:strand:- start:86 stop:349 length:264 start_codon:yes stop_codon:yes gene_type:complete